MRKLQVAHITQDKQTTVSAAGVSIPVAKKLKNTLVGGLIGAAGTFAVFSFTPLAPFAIVGGMAGFGAGGLIGKLVS
jgi:hypothetical protein